MLHIAPSLLSRHPNGRWPDGSPVQDVANLLDVQHCVGVLVRGGDLDGGAIIFSQFLDPEISGCSGSRKLHIFADQESLSLKIFGQ